MTVGAQFETSASELQVRIFYLPIKAESMGPHLGAGLGSGVFCCAISGDL